ncbi:Carboxylesterase family-domain-containing protein [Mycena capillaripes]|nr:Carboxylesterase family-domain-containing protein [Mycena capillaripes]
MPSRQSHTTPAVHRNPRCTPPAPDPAPAVRVPSSHVVSVSARTSPKLHCPPCSLPCTLLCTQTEDFSHFVSLLCLPHSVVRPSRNKRSIHFRGTVLHAITIIALSCTGRTGIMARQTSSLKWVQAHIASFGGHSSGVTIFGQSADAGSVRVLFGSPSRSRLFAGAIAQSNLAGFAYASTYSEYCTIEPEADVAAGNFVVEVRCENSAATEVLACLGELPSNTLQDVLDAPRCVYIFRLYASVFSRRLNPALMGMSSWAGHSSSGTASPSTTRAPCVQRACRLRLDGKRRRAMSRPVCCKPIQRG